MWNVRHVLFAVAYLFKFGSVLREDRCLQALSFALFLFPCSSHRAVALQGHSVHVCNHLATGFHLAQSGPTQRSVYKISVNT